MSVGSTANTKAFSPIALGVHATSAFGTGVATYSAMLKRALSLAGIAPIAVESGNTNRFLSRQLRWLRSLSPGARHAHRTPVSIIHDDVFKKAQVFFDIHKRPLEIIVPGDPGIAHWTYPMPIMFSGWRNIYTIHDAIPLQNPAMTAIKAKRHRRLLNALIARADRFVTVSQAARNEIVEAMQCDPAFVANLGQAVEVPLIDASQLPLGLERNNYLLFCGTIEHRKNIGRLIEGYRLSQLAIPLILVGPKGEGADELLRQVDKLSQVKYLGYLGRDDLAQLMRGARGVALPSLAEGFGLPVVEAMACGVPVLTSNRAALVEVAGDAALLVDPLDPVSIADGLFTLATDRSLREQLVRRGEARSVDFALPAYGQRMSQFYSETIDGRR